MISSGNCRFKDRIFKRFACSSGVGYSSTQCSRTISLSLTERNKLTVYGVTEVVSFEENAVTIDVTVMVRYGVNITEICKNAQDTIAMAVDSITGVKPQVNVRVAGISFDK